MSKKLGSKKILVPKQGTEICDQWYKHFGWQICYRWNYYVNFKWLITISVALFGQKYFRSKKYWESKKVWSKKVWVPKNLGPQKRGSKKFGKNQVSISWDILDLDTSLSPGQMPPCQMSPSQLALVKDGPRNLSLKFGQYRSINSWDVADVEFTVVGGGGGLLCYCQTPVQVQQSSPGQKDKELTLFFPCHNI